MRKIQSLSLLALVVCGIVSMAGCSGSESKQLMDSAANYINDDSVGVMVIDVEKFDLQAIVQKIANMLPAEAQAAFTASADVSEPQGKMKEFVAAGGRYMIVVMNSKGGEPLIIVPLVAGFDEAKLLAVWNDSHLKAARVGDNIIVRGENANSPDPAPSAARRALFEKGLDNVSGRICSIVVVKPEGDLPIPPQVKAMAGSLMNDFNWMALGFDAVDKLKIDLVIQTKDRDTAIAMHGAIKGQLAMAQGATGMDEAVAKKIIDPLTPQVSGDQLRLSLTEAQIREIVSEATKAMNAMASGGGSMPQD